MAGTTRLIEVDMFNCCKQRQCFFEKYKSMDCNWLIAYLIIAGDRGPFNSVHEAYVKGHERLRLFRREWERNPNRCWHEGLCERGDVDYVDFLGLHRTAYITLINGMFKDKKGSLLLIDGDQLSTSMEELKRSCEGDIIACNSSQLLLRDCKSFKGIDICLNNIKTLTVLEISGVFDDIPHIIFPELTQLQLLKLSGHMSELHEECFSKLKQLRCLSLRGCQKLRILPTSVQDLSNLEVLDLSLSGISSGIMISSPKLQMVSLCSTGLTSIPQLETTKLTHLFLTGTKLSAYTGTEIMHPSALQVLDLSMATQLEQVDLSPHNDLRVVRLSYTIISSIDSVSDKVHLRKLILRFCPSLRKLPTLEKLESLEVLDLSETQVRCLPTFANPSRLLKLSLGNLTLDSLENLASLSSLVELDLHDVEIRSSEEFEVGFVESLENLQILNLSGTKVAELPGLAKLTSLKKLQLARCRHLNTLPDLKILTNIEKLVLSADYGYYNELALTKTSTVEEEDINDRYILGDKPIPIGNLTNIITTIKYALGRTSHHGNNTVGEFDSNAATTTTTSSINKASKRRARLELLKAEFEYIAEHIDTLMSSPNSDMAKQILQILPKFYHVGGWNSSTLQQLARACLKLKLMVPRIPTSGSESKPLDFTQRDKKIAGNDVDNKWGLVKIPQAKTAQHLSSYESLTDDQKQCLLCFAAFPGNIDTHISNLNWKTLEIRKKILIYWWIGEGLIDLDSEENGSIEVSKEFAPTQRCKRKKTVEEFGEQILKVLTEKEFIEPVIEKGRDIGRCRMHPLVHSFVIDRAKQAKFFDFSSQNGKLTTSFTQSRRAFLLKSDDKFPSSCHLWNQDATSSIMLKSFTTVRTLFNVNESFLNIQPEWFSKMKDLSTLHLGDWESRDAKHIEVKDQKFLENLKKMKQLKLFSLQGVSTITKLPDSVCKVSSLIILDLRECHDLEELPADIGSLKNLRHLDLTNCHLLHKLPKGISLLLKLEVLKGFVICDQSGDPQDKKASIPDHWWKMAKGHLKHDLLRFKNSEVCMLRDLLKLQNLRKLSIVVNNKNFPDGDDLQVLKEMANLCKLMISWERSFKEDDENVNRGQVGTDQRDDKSPKQDQGDIKAIEEDSGDIEAPEVDQEDDRETEEDQGEIKAPEDSSNTYRQCSLYKESNSKSLSVERAKPESQNADGQEVLMGGKCLELMKCFMQQSNKKDREKNSRREFLDQIEKLELWCFPHETTPDWLVPNQLKNLQKLYIRGGKLRSLCGGINGSKWNVKTLRLKYLPDLEMSWTDLKAMFPQMTYCEKMIFSPCEECAWRIEYELP